MKTIIINGREKDVPRRKLSYDELVLLAYGPGKDGVQTITYSRGPKSKPQGSVCVGESVNLANGMSFDIVSTSQA